MKRILTLCAFAVCVLFPSTAKAQVNQRAFGYCAQGGVIPTVSGLQLQNAAGSAVQNVMANYPGCTVTVYFSGTLTLATIFSDTLNTPLANPFTANATTGYWFFYAASGRYDVQLSGAGIITPFTLGDISVGSTGGGGGGGATPAPPPFALQKANPTATNLAASGILDNGATVVNPEPWSQLANADFKGPNPYVSITAFGAVAGNPSTTPYAVGLTANCQNGSNQVTISSPSTFQNPPLGGGLGSGVIVFGCGNPHSMSTPAAPTVTPSVALAGTGTLLNTPGAACSSTVNYYVMARDRNGGLTAPSLVGSTTTGCPLGAQSVNVTSFAVSGQTVTATTASAHGFLIGCNFSTCGEGFIGGGNGLTDPTFRGWFTITSAVDSTHFTFNRPQTTALGATTSATGGTVTYFSENAVSWTAVTPANSAAYYGVYSDRALSGTCSLIGVSNALSSVGTQDLSFEDFGSPMMDNQAFPFIFPTSFPCGTPPSATSDSLSTTITAGAGTTTLTLANAAGTTVNNKTILLDACPGMVAAGASISGGNGSLLIPAASFGNSFVVNSWCQLSGGNYAVAQHGPLYLNDTIEFTASGNGGDQWIGQPLPQASGRASVSSWSAGPSVTINAAHPGFYFSGGQFGLHVSHLSINSVPANGTLGISVDGGFNQTFDWIDCQSGLGASDYMSSCFLLRGSPGQSSSNVTFDYVGLAPGGGGDGVSHTPTINGRGIGNISIPHSYSVHRGMFSAGVTTQLGVGGIAYINGGGTPLLTSFNQIANVTVGNVTMDTIAQPCVAALSTGNAIPAVNFLGTPCVPSSSVLPVSGAPTLTQGSFGADHSATTLGAIGIQTGSISDSLFGFVNNYPQAYFNSSVAIGKNYNLFVQGDAPVITSCPVSAGGSLSVGPHVFTLVPLWWNGNQGRFSATCTATTTSGNQTVTLNYSAFAGNPQLLRIYDGVGNRLTNVTAAANATSVVVSSETIIGGTQDQFSSGGPTMLLPAAQGIATPSLILAGNTLTAPSNGGFTFTLPSNTGTLAETNFAQTFTANQSIANGNSIRWFSNNGTNYAGFTGGASTVNLVWLFPTTDSSGTQCLSSNGSLQLAWSACSAGTGTPGGANTQVQFNNSGSFGGSGNLTWVSPLLTIGVSGAATGQLALTGATSGTVTITPQAAAGSPTLTLPNTTGTFAVGASAPLSLSATTGNLTCPTCTTNAAALTNNLIVLGAGGQATQIGPAGTTTTVLHGNAAGAPTYAAVNLATDTTGITAIANGGSGQSTASAAFNALAPATAAGGLILGTGTNTYGNLAIGGNGLCLVSNGTTAAWSSCAAGSVGGNGVSGQVAFWNGASSIAGNVNWTYAAASGQSLTQGANGADAFFMKRFTDTTPTGNFLHFQNNAANTDVAKLDVNGNLSVGGSVGVNSATIAGTISLGQGAAPVLVANTIELIAPTSVAASGEIFAFPGNPSSGFIRWTNSSGTLTGNFAPASGVGTCSATTVVNQTNDNAAPTCTNLLASMFTSQGANQVLAAPNGSAGVPTFRTLANADVPAVLLNSGGNGGVVNILGIANGGTNASTAAGGFNNLSPMTTQGDIIYGGASGAGTRLAAGTSTQVLIGGTTPSWGAVNVGTMQTGTLPIGNGGTGQTTASAAFNALAPPASANALIYSNGTNTWTALAAGGAGTLCLTETAGGAPTWGSCSGSAATAWSSLTNPSGNLSLSMGANTTTLTWNAATGASVNPFTLTDTTNNTGTGDLVLINTASGSALSPFRVAAKGTANGIEMNTSGVLASIGTGSITANTLNQALNTTAPLGGGGTQTSALTLTCTTCLTSGSALTNNAIVIGSGGGQGTASASAGSSGQILQSNGSSAPTWITFPNTSYAPAANCVNSTAGSAWSTGATPAALCRAGSNNLGGLLSPWGASDVAQVVFHIDKDTDLTTNLPALMLELTSTDATNSHTIIMQESISCAKEDGSTTDDVAFNAARSFSTITLNGNANRTWQANITLNSTDLTGCSAPGLIIVKLSRTTDTATNVGVYGLNFTQMRLLAVQAN